MKNLKSKHEFNQDDFDKPELIDKADRQESLKFVKNIVNNVGTPYVLALNGPWGIGKTVFLKMLQSNINADHRIVYHSAWEHDYSSDPLLSLMSSLKKEFKLESKYPDLFESAGRIALGTLPQIASILTAGLLPNGVSEDLLSNLAKSLSKEATKSKDGVTEFKSKLQVFINSEIADKKLVFIIDDLDRCRPTYAIELLEKIKHLFNIEKVVFILGIDRVQLEHSIKAVYGYKYDAKKYLIRFFDTEYYLPQVISRDYLQHLIDELSLTEFFKTRYSSRGLVSDEGPLNQIQTVILYLNKHYKFDMREIQRILHLFALISLTSNSADEIEPIIMLSLLIFNKYDEDLYNISVFKGNVDFKGVEKIVSMSDVSSNEKETMFYGYLAGMTLSCKDFNDTFNDDLKGMCPDDLFFNAALKSRRISADYIIRTQKFINGSAGFY